MFLFNVELAFLYAIFLFSLLSVFLSLWVVWHVEKKLDVSYKFFAFAIIFFSVGVLLEILQFYGVLVFAGQWEKIFKAAFIILFTVGVFEMYDLVLALEKQKKSEVGVGKFSRTVKTVAKKIKK